MAHRRQAVPRRRVDIKQVAEEAGVSTATVSRVLSNTGYASDTSRARVTQAADRLGYQPDAMARGLRRKKSTTLGILVPELTNPVTLSFIRGVQHVAQPCGYAVAIGDAQRDAGIERRQLELFKGQRVAAVIVAGALRDPGSLSVLEADTPIIHSPAALERHSTGETEAINDALGDLARHGHRRVLYVTRAPVPDPRATNPRTERRRQSIMAAAARHGMEVDQCSTPMELSTTETAKRVGQFVGGTGTGPGHGHGHGHAIICASHRLAPQLLGTLSDLRLALPQQLSFITFGDSDWARAYRPSVAVIRFDRYREARRVTYDVLLSLGSSPQMEDAPTAPEYVPRGSVGPCPPDEV
jgi:DNA-binding LacI/PurR family transcriptional regulator